MPVLVIAGQEDEIAPAPGQHTFVAGLPDAELVMLDGVGHLIHYEQPAVPRTRSAASWNRSGEDRRRLPLHAARAPRRHQPLRGAHRRGAGAAGRGRRASHRRDADQRREAAHDAARPAVDAGVGSDERPRALGVAAGEQAATGCGVHSHADDGRGGAPVRSRQDPARPDLLPQSHASARSEPRHPAALAPVPPGLVAAARAAEPGGRGRHRLRDLEGPDRGAPAHQAAADDRAKRRGPAPGRTRPPRPARHPRPALHGLVHAVQERRDPRAGDARAAGVPPAPAVEDRPGRPPPAARARACRAR